jgi:hypothetical protein
MGLLKSARQIHKQANEIGKSWDPAAQMAQAQVRMAETNETLARLTAAAGLAASGADATATVVAARETGTMLNMQPVLEIDLTVTPDGQGAFPVSVKQPIAVTQVAALQPGAVLHVKYDPADRSTVWIGL